jgi:hypothetical protein
LLCVANPSTRYLAKFPGEVPSAEVLGIGEYQEELVGVRIRRGVGKVGKKKMMPMVIPEVLEVPEVSKVTEVEGAFPIMPGIVGLPEIIKGGSDEEPEWGFREWETWRSSGVAENRDSGTYYISRDKAKGPEDWKDGELGYSGFVGDDGRPCSHRRRAAVLPL